MPEIPQYFIKSDKSKQLQKLINEALKFLHLEKTKLRELNFFELSDGELLDIVAYSENKNWLYLIEAVHSSGVISNVRLL